MGPAGHTIGPASALSAPRRLLARVRDVMAGAAPAQERLDDIVKIIAADMVAEVCSLYVRRGGSYFWPTV